MATNAGVTLPELRRFPTEAMARRAAEKNNMPYVPLIMNPAVQQPAKSSANATRSGGSMQPPPLPAGHKGGGQQHSHPPAGAAKGGSFSHSSGPQQGRSAAPAPSGPVAWEDRPCDFHSRPGHPAQHTNGQCSRRQAQQAHSPAMAQPKCHNCGKSDHFIRDCPQLARQPAPHAASQQPAPAAKQGFQQPSQHSNQANRGAASSSSAATPKPAFQPASGQPARDTSRSAAVSVSDARTNLDEYITQLAEEAAVPVVAAAAFTPDPAVVGWLQQLKEACPGVAQRLQSSFAACPPQRRDSLR